MFLPSELIRFLATKMDFAVIEITEITSWPGARKKILRAT